MSAFGADAEVRSWRTADLALASEMILSADILNSRVGWAAEVGRTLTDLAYPPSVGKLSEWR